ncbi:hypothetical protein [Dysgonomonas sp. 511]|uniref:hypothetical protein n=1 Tax=Dysgonomonas sp. 511 TaxID=2302930 RepID=UPI0013D5B1DC|nr:hypothetical protein [Dysgonomonas sp. 511]NDV79344.1 hypothetical protein [Dysgonomonas sp. 511]
MKSVITTYILLPFIMVAAWLFTSCDSLSDDNSALKGIEGHWIYTSTKAEVQVADPSVRQKIIDYIENRYKGYHVSYELKNDKTYYYYINYAEPLKGIYQMTGKNLYSLDDIRGMKTVVRENSYIHIVSDLKEDIASILDIDENTIQKANAVDSFERGLAVSE